MSGASGEERLIERHFAPLAAGYPGAFGLADDCAAISVPPGCDLVVKTDPVAAGVHFFEDDAAGDIAWKALAVNVSDLAAKGATPLAYVMALSFPDRPETGWLEAFANGLGEAQRSFGMHLIGGDTDRRPGPVSISITAFAAVPAGRMLRRGGARPGDRIYVTGTIGDACLGLDIRRGLDRAATLDAAERRYLLDRYLRPEPRLALGPVLLAHASASMDVSDGLMKDLDRMCRASGTGATVWIGEIPLSDAAVKVVRDSPAVLQRLATAGDDYELLVAVPPSQAAEFERVARDQVRSTCIGEMTATAGLSVHDVDGRPIALDRLGYDHF